MEIIFCYAGCIFVCFVNCFTFIYLLVKTDKLSLHMCQLKKADFGKLSIIAMVNVKILNGDVLAA